MNVSYLVHFMWKPTCSSNDTSVSNKFTDNRGVC